jgi:hypothetical protein
MSVADKSCIRAALSKEVLCFSDLKPSTPVGVPLRLGRSFESVGMFKCVQPPAGST